MERVLLPSEARWEACLAALSDPVDDLLHLSWVSLW